MSFDFTSEIQNSTFRNYLLIVRLFFAVFVEEVKIAVNSEASLCKSIKSSAFTRLLSINNSSQKTVSSASSSTIPNFAINSALDLALQAAR